MEKDIKKIYFNKLHESSIAVHEFIEKEINKISKSIPADLFFTFKSLPEKRFSKNTLRPFLTKIIFNVLSNDSSNDNLPVYVLSEINNYFAYLDNWILDNKNKIWNENKQRKTISHLTIASALFREISENIIHESNIDVFLKEKILGIFNKATISSYIGQAIDMEMSIKTISGYSSDEEYLQNYIKKSYLQSGCLYGASLEAGAILANVDDETRNRIKELGEVIGTGLHISNDLGDFAILGESSDFKNYQDQMADIRNGRLSLPIYWVLKYGNEYEKNIFKSAVTKKELTEDERILIVNVLHSSGAYTYCKKVIRSYYTI